MAQLSFRIRSLASGAASALIAVFVGACGEGLDGGPGTERAAATSFAPRGNQDPEQPNSAPGNENTPGGPTAPAPAGTNPEAQPGEIPLTPGMSAPAGTSDSMTTTPGTTTPGTTTPGTTTPGTTAPGTTTPGMQPPASNLPDAELERPTRGTPNLFTDLLGIPEGQVNAKVIQAINRFFGIGTNESATPTRDAGFRVYYELPQDRSMAFIWTTDANDIRSEGMSYGMMLAVQMDLQTQFDALWKFARTFMQFPATSGITSWRYNFRWQGTVNTANANNWQINFGANTGPAPDGDEYFAAALYLADRRWGSGGGVNYEQDADNIAHALISNPSANGNTPLFNAANNLVVFYPAGGTANYTDPSYNLPAFYELFALDGPAGDAARWNTIADASRRLIVASANATTGLHPDYANFNGTPNSGGSNHNQFRYDAWRVIMNMAVDYAWFSQDPRFTTQANKYHAFFANQLTTNNVRNAIFTLDGATASGGSSTALTSTLASGAIASNAQNRDDYVQAAWNVGQQSGQYRYYQEAIYLLGLLNTAGVFGYEWNAGQ